jgi:hypothetical protein
MHKNRSAACAAEQGVMMEKELFSKMIFPKLVIFLIALITSCICRAEQDPKLDMLLSLVKPTVLKLQIAPTRSQPVIYELTRGTNPELRITRYEGLGGYEWGEIEKEFAVVITVGENKNLLSLLDQALDLPLKDKTMGRDGSIWILESRLYGYAKISIWSPGYKTASRGYTNLVSLESYLSSLNSKYETK